MKNIVICCDGTGNQYGSTNTNVVKLFQAVDLSSDTKPKQVAYYDPGVGTGNPRGFTTRTRVLLSQISGLAFGSGVYRNIADSYLYLMENYEPGDRVYIFGFSRGAYTVRALVGILHMLGLLHSGSSNLVPYALELYRKRIPKEKDKKADYFRIAQGFKRTYSNECKPHFVGVWDTVKTVGIWDALKVMAKWQTTLPYTYSMPDVSFGRHAISIDEKRSRFRSNLWEARGDNNMQQVWFAGVHSDVGGGYSDSGLSDIALTWILKGAQHHGLILRPDAFEQLNPDPTQEMHNSLIKNGWFLLGWKPRSVRGPGKWNQSMKSWQMRPPAIHKSVQTRMEEKDYSPSLPQDIHIVDDSWDSYFE
ncbi:MAG: DUF2235 domain-containing protein [Candidatus Thiodiazotropha lotti]|nr:DUF2235 domain-containing protein [Candidatus Thiodiazotropha lotti]MCW4222577.1 DUF2235 domain-containing protein [Candidatus Thiodiazotropha lotti]